MSEVPKKDVILTAGEKVGGVAVTLGMVAAGGYGLYLATPAIKEIASGVDDVFKIAGAAVIIGGAVYVASDPDVRGIAGRWYRLGVRWLRRKTMEWDPIGNLEMNIAHMEKREREMVMNRKALQAQIAGLKKRIERMEGEMEAALGIMQSEQKRGNSVNVNATGDEDQENAASLAENRYGRREASVKRLQTMLTTLEATAKTLKRIHSGVKFLIEDTRDEVNNARIELAASTAAGNAADNAMDVIRGDARLMQMYREAMQVIDDKIAERMGAVEMAVNDSKGFLATVDNKNFQYKKSALKALQRWEKNVDYLQLNPNQKKARVESADDEETEAAQAAPAAQKVNAVSNLFD